MLNTLNTDHQEPLLSPRELIEQLPLADCENLFIQESRTTIHNILLKKDPRFLIILGPCSIHNTDSAKEYAIRVRKLRDKVASHLFLVMRVYVDKPRTLLGWKGLLHDPYLDGSNNMNKGLSIARKLLLDIIKLQVPTAMEFLELMSINYLADLISWGCIGARTAASQPHRQIASLLPMPVGFKNGVDGNLNVAVEGAMAAKASHSFMNINVDGKVSHVRSKGNACSHIVLRGGGGQPNFDPQSIAFALSLLEQAKISKELIIDCAHGNSGKNHNLQKNVFYSVIEQVTQGNPSIVGAMLESHLFSGNQEHSQKRAPHYATSLTDPCIDWQTTEELVMHAYHSLSQQAIEKVLL